MTPPTIPPQPSWRAHLLPVLILAVALTISFIVRIRLLDAPLERDEGEHAYLAQTLLSGHAPWQIAYNLKLPGTDFAYALFLALFGQTAVAIRVGLLFVTTATTLLLTFLGRRLFGFTGGAVAGAAFTLLSCSQNVFGTVAHSTFFVILFAVPALLLLLRAGMNARSLFCSGLLFGFAFLMKQPGLVFAVFACFVVVWRWREMHAPFREGMKGLAALTAGVAGPYALLCLWLWRAGTFGRFWFWTVTLAGAFAGQMPASALMTAFTHRVSGVLGPNLPLWLLAALGLILAGVVPTTRRAALFTGMLLLFSFGATVLGSSFSPHYFIVVLPALALAVGAGVAAAVRIPDRTSSATGARIAEGAALLLFVAACLCSVIAQRNYLFAMTPEEFSRNTYGQNPFPEARVVADYIRAHSAPDEKIVVLGSEAEIYFYSHRRAATGYLFMYGLMETHPYAAASQGEMIGEIEAAKPTYLVYVSIPTSWMPLPGSSRAIFSWLDDYVRRGYDIVGVVDQPPQRPSLYIWGSQAALYRPASPAYLLICRRKS